jgi:glycosyltransferase involved in cell wall biosynthesis
LYSFDKNKKQRDYMRKLIILPGNCKTLGGTLVSLSMLITGVKNQQLYDNLCVLVQAGSTMEKYFQNLELDFCLQAIPAATQKEFFRRGLEWVSKQPKDYPLLLDNCVYSDLLPTFLSMAPMLRLSGRTIYHFCHDLVNSNKFAGYLARRCIFSCLSPRVLCNSNFTAQHVRHLMPNIQGVLYQPINQERFNDVPLQAPPKELQSILQSGFRIMLTPSRINKHPKDGENCDKNLRALIPILAHLKTRGYDYHSVVIGEDTSLDKSNSRILLEKAQEFGVAERFTILPAVSAIEDYYKCADVVVTLAHKEAFGRTIVEAIACSVPVVASSTGGMGEILNQLAPDWMVDPNNPSSAAEAIINIANNPNTCQILSQAKSWVNKHCSANEYAFKIMNITEVISVDTNKNDLYTMKFAN